MHNDRFTNYYRSQNMLPDDEWDAFMETLRAPLPTTFRVAGSRQRSLNATLRDTHVPTLSNVEFEHQPIPPPVQIPCGDGTMRKNLGIWQPMDGNGLHVLQLRILQRAMKMLAPQGRIVYSACSLNPVENEAVIACALRNNPDFRLVDMSVKLPALHRRPRLTAWKPTDKSLCTTYDTYDTFMKTCTESDTVKAKMLRGHWPPEDVEKLELPRCLRIYPHLQDTGGFFVAVLERTGTKTEEEAVEAPSSSSFHLTPAFPSSNVLVRTPDGDTDVSVHGHRNLYITNAAPPRCSPSRRRGGARTRTSAREGARIVGRDMASLRILVEKAYPLRSAFLEKERGLKTLWRDGVRLCSLCALGYLILMNPTLNILF
ncbi:hypothetical protein K438DRAFT_1952768 [Mycena galopus ATCC 62051]|nr:hypothetical protein K438DRAFT_1952768 [Mycena galopus ATCC 62051]